MRNALLLIILVFAGLSISAQTTTLRGTVADENGMVIPDAYVTVRSGDTVLFQTRTDSEGRFFANVRQRQVSIEIKAEGFEEWKMAVYRVPQDPITELGTITLKFDKNYETEKCFVPCEIFPIEPGQPRLSARITNRPIPPPPAPQKIKPAKKKGRRNLN